MCLYVMVCTCCSVFEVPRVYIHTPHQVNIIPIIAKADVVSRSELPQFKARVSDEESLLCMGEFRDLVCTEVTALHYYMYMYLITIRLIVSEFLVSNKCGVS